MNYLLCILILLVEGAVVMQVAVFLGSKVFHFSDITKFLLKSAKRLKRE
jgi:hypothetical protein